MDFSTFIQQVVNALSLGSMYSLIAIGYTMVYGTLRLINFAHGEIMMVASFILYFSSSVLNLTFGEAVLLSIVGAALLGYLINAIAYKPLRNAPRISLLITAIGVSFLLQNLFNVLFGGIPRGLNVPEYFSKVYTIGRVIIPITTIIIPVVTVISLVVVVIFMMKTKYGIAIRALAFDNKTVRLMGINIDFIISLVFIIGSILAAIGGIFYSIRYPSIDPLMGVMVGLKAFAAAVLGGIGSITGAVVGGLILGFTEVMTVAFFPNLGGYKDAFAFIFLIFILIFRPTGIIGEKLGKRF